MIVYDYLEEHDLDCGDVIFMTEEGREIKPYGCLIVHCQIVSVDGNVLVVR